MITSSGFQQILHSSISHHARQEKKIGMQGVEKFIVYKLKAPGSAYSTQWTFNSYERLIQQVCLVTMYSKKKIEFVLP